MVAASPSVLSLNTAVHRIGGGGIANLRLKPSEEQLAPPGISVLLGGTPAEAAEQMRQAFPDPQRYVRIRQLAERVGSATVATIRAAGFEVIPDPSAKFPNHGRIIHFEGVVGFSDANLERLAEAFQDSSTPRV